MNCSDARDLIHAYVDGEVDLVRNLEIEQHVHSCSGCSTVLANARALKAAVKDGGFYHHPPPRLRQQVLQALAREGGGAPQPEPWWRNWRMVLPLAAACLVVTVSWSVYVTRPTENDRLLDDLATGHVRSMKVNHMTDVVSSDRNTVQPWFEGKLDFEPMVKDVSPGEFPLVGGRLDYINDRPMAAVVYRHNDHYINVFMWRMSCEDVVPEKITPRQKYNVAQWTQGPIGFAAVSDVNQKELASFAESLKK